MGRLPTPLQPLLHLSDISNTHRLWVKRDDLSGNLLTGNKVRKLEYLIADAQEKGFQRLITCGGIQSNHCRATAVAGAQLQLAVDLVLRIDGDYEPGEMPDGNLFLAELAGARLHILSALEFRQHYKERMNELAAAGNGYIIPTGGSNPVGLWGYHTAAGELQRDFLEAGIEKPHIVLATGSGGTQAGLIAGAIDRGLQCQIWGVNVCDNAKWFTDKIIKDLLAWKKMYSRTTEIKKETVRIIEGYRGPAYGSADKAVYSTIKMVAEREGLVLDPCYTAKAFHAMITEINKGTFGTKGDIVFLHTGGVFGLFANRTEMYRQLNPDNCE